MTQNNSTVAGFIVPEDLSWDSPGATFDNPDQFFDVNPAPAYDAVLDAIFQPLLAGVTGLAGALVLPRWQIVPANRPAVLVNWCAFGVSQHDGATNAYIGHQSVQWDQRSQQWDGNQSFDETPQQGQRDVLEMQEDVDVLCSFYGPQCRGNAAMMRDGMQVSQNRETLPPNNMGYVSAGPIRTLPELLNNLWYQRADVILYFRRAVVRTYPVFDLLSAQGTVESDDPSVTRAFTSSKE
jgi:hypothetical protein